MTHLLHTKTWTARFDRESGRLLSLRDKLCPDAEWISEGGKFGVPILSSNQEVTRHLPLKTAEADEQGLLAVSASGMTRLRWTVQGESLCGEYHGSDLLGPRSGLQLDLNFLDSPSETGWGHQCMPHILYSQEDRSYAYFVFATADRRYLTLCVEAPFAAWKICYSAAGHRMTGFQLLSQADDVRTPDRRLLSAYTKLLFSVTPCDSLDTCWAVIRERLGVAPVQLSLTGAPVDGSVRYTVTPAPEKLTLMDPNGEKTPLVGAEGVLTLTQEGVYTVKSRLGNRSHQSRIYCHPGWEQVYDKVNRFYRDHFQDESGAFYRVIWKDTLSPKGGVTMEGLPFGDINVPYSCRTGEFGGFAGWAMMKNALLFGEKEEFTESMQRYLLHWALNRGHEDTPYGGTVCHTEQDYLGRHYGPWHLYHEVNYPQHEEFLMEQMLDYYDVTGDESVLRDAASLGEHFVREHMRDGRVICQNEPEGHEVDYCTVHASVACLLGLYQHLDGRDSQKAEFFRQAAEALADTICARKFDFPTEGEPCTEDGSMACSALCLLLAYIGLAPKPEYLAVAREILAAHEVLTLGGTDCRMNGSSTRFWETQYESRDWGPSINAGHAWTLWMAQAKVLLACLDRDFDLLGQAYNAFVTNLCKIEPNGGMPSCYTPDLIPSMPHPPYVYGLSGVEREEILDLHISTSFLGERYVEKTYACSGNYLLIAAEPTFARVSGVSFTKKQAINGSLTKNELRPAAPRLSALLVEGAPESPVTLTWQGEQAIELLFADEEAASKVEVTGADFAERQDSRIILSFMEKQKTYEVTVQHI